MQTQQPRHLDGRWRQVISLPHTQYGRISLALAGGFVLAMAMFFSLATSGQTGGDTFFDSLWLATTILTAGVLVLAAGATSAIAIVFHRERSIINVAITLVGLLALVFIVGEFAMPH
jgi:hypothetical protein